jgi:hypothetical protein
MKARLAKALFGLALVPLFLLTGCKDEASTVMWWMPDPWTPMQPVVPAGNSMGGSTASGGGAVAGGG